ncbi:unnamed protein product [Ceutorhynchus assimilis]|uniref:Protein quiver n=1 Tax=Ceutorhynchus assimilis TaxID=467358 RepID=A0A9N9QAX1_9CUCU|nr:unnamed protein product [Ceutorhynchus assimilis]
MLSKVSILAVLAVGAYLSVSNIGADASLMCYTCNTTDQCSSPVDKKNLNMTTCGEGEQCVKFNYHSAKNWTDILTWRGCNKNQTCDTLNTTWSNINQTLAGCWLCNKNHCNSASTFAVPLVAMLVSFLAVKFVQ